MNLIFEFDLQEDTTPDQLADFLRFWETWPSCNGTYTYENATPPMENNGRISFGPNVPEHEQVHLHWLFRQMRVVKAFESVYESPAVMSGVIGTDVHTNGARDAHERAGGVDVTHDSDGRPITCGAALLEARLIDNLHSSRHQH